MSFRSSGSKVPRPHRTEPSGGDSWRDPYLIFFHSYTWKQRMFYAYVLKSVDSNFLYKGPCENPGNRLREHNSGKTRSIKAYLPFMLVYFETFDTRNEAFKGKDILRALQAGGFFPRKISRF